jgi:hypothetical protein
MARKGRRSDWVGRPALRVAWAAAGGAAGASATVLAGDRRRLVERGPPASRRVGRRRSGVDGSETVAACNRSAGPRC